MNRTNFCVVSTHSVEMLDRLKKWNQGNSLHSNGKYFGGLCILLLYENLLYKNLA